MTWGSQRVRWRLYIGKVVPKEVVVELRLHPVTVQKLCRDGKLRCSRVGRSYRIPWDAFENYKKGLSVEAKVLSFVPTLESELSTLVKAWLHHLEHGLKPCEAETIKTHATSSATPGDCSVWVRTPS